MKVLEIVINNVKFDMHIEQSCMTRIVKKYSNATRHAPVLNNGHLRKISSLNLHHQSYFSSLNTEQFFYQIFKPPKNPFSLQIPQNFSLLISFALFHFILYVLFNDTCFVNIANRTLFDENEKSKRFLNNKFIKINTHRVE